MDRSNLHRGYRPKLPQRRVTSNLWLAPAFSYYATTGCDGTPRVNFLFRGHNMRTSIITFASILVLTAACLCQRASVIPITAQGQGSAQSDGTATGILQATQSADQQAQSEARSNLQSSCSGRLESAVVIYDVCNGSEAISCNVTMQGLCRQ